MNLNVAVLCFCLQFLCLFLVCLSVCLSFFLFSCSTLATIISEADMRQRYLELKPLFTLHFLQALDRWPG